jgi:Protein of Unknown function (DUF2784)
MAAPCEDDSTTERLNTLRDNQTASGFIERWIDRLLFYDAPTWVFTAAYVAFAALVLVTWVAVPPTRGAHKR